jgi:hypothetical protein
MSKTRKKIGFLYDNRRSGKQIIRDGLRNKLKNKEDTKQNHKPDRHAVLTEIAMRKMFSDGYSIEEIRKRLVERYCSPYEANALIEKIDTRWNKSLPIKVEIRGLVSINEQNIIFPPSVTGMDLGYVIFIGLPIYRHVRYLLSNITKKVVLTDPFWSPGEMIYNKQSLYKLDVDMIKSHKTIHETTKLYNKVILWPNERVTTIAEEAIKIHIDSGMEECEFLVYGWNKLKFRIETKGSAA